MSDKFYVVRGVGPGLDGLVVTGPVHDDSYIRVQRMIDRDTVVGDRHPSVQLPECSVLISLDYLEETEDPTDRQYASNNPFGAFVLDVTMRCGNIEAVLAQYERALSVSILNRIGDTKQTVYSENFLHDFEAVKKAVETETEKGDLSELVFVLKSIKELEAAAQKVRAGETE